MYKTASRTDGGFDSGSESQTGEHYQSPASGKRNSGHNDQSTTMLDTQVQEQTLKLLEDGKGLSSAGTNAPATDFEVNTQPPEADQLEQLGIATQRIASQQTRFAALRAQAMQVRDEVSHHRLGYSRAQGYLVKSLREAITSFKGLSNDVSLPEFFSRFQLHCEQLEKDHKRVQEHEAKVNVLEVVLSNIEYQMQEEEQKLADQAEAATNAIEQLHFSVSEDVMATEDDTDQTLTGRTEVESLHPLLAEYYDKLGEFKVMHSRLVDFETENSSKRATLVFEVEHERAHQSSVDALDQSASLQRSQLQRICDQAMSVSDAARAQCIEAGLDPDAYKLDLPDHFEEAPFISADDIIPVYSEVNEPHQASPPILGPFDPPPIANLSSQSWSDPPSMEADALSEDRTRNWIEQNALYEHHSQPRPPEERSQPAKERPGVENAWEYVPATEKGGAQTSTADDLSNRLPSHTSDFDTRVQAERRAPPETQAQDLLQSSEEPINP